MPAYRSPQEAVVRDAVVARLRQLRPGARIIHEINTAGTGSNRIDVLAVDRAEIIAVEVKSEKDKLDRLPDQIRAMRSVAHFTIAALHEKHLVPAKHRVWASTGVFTDTSGPDVQAPEQSNGATVWAWPEAGSERGRNWSCSQWDKLRLEPCKALPDGALFMLWSEELVRLCAEMGISVGKRPNIRTMVRALRWGATGSQITKGICAALRARACIEADPPCGSPPANDNTITQAKEATHG